MRASRLSAALILFTAAGTVHGQCTPTFSPGFAFGPLDGTVLALAVYDDGAGPALYAGGVFYHTGTTPVSALARWSGSAWVPVPGSNIDGLVRCMVVYDDDGAGPNRPSLVIGGSFDAFTGTAFANGIVRWNGTSWSTFGTGTTGDVWALAVVDYTGTAALPRGLYAGGQFTQIGSATVSNLGAWYSGAWHPLGAAGAGPDSLVQALSMFDPDGSGPQAPYLCIGGQFTTAGGASAPGIARWDGTSWATIGGGLGGAAVVNAMTLVDLDGPGPGLPALFVGGYFSRSGGITSIARWNGTAWSAMPGLPGSFPEVDSLASYDDDGPAGPHTPTVCAGLRNTPGSPTSNCAYSWNGSSWTSLGSGVLGGVYALAEYDPDGAGPATPRLAAGGGFTIPAPAAAAGIASWSGTAWSSLGPPLQNGVSDAISALAVFDDDGAGPHLPALYAAGVFGAAGSSQASEIARWNGSNWTGLTPIGYPSINAILVFDDDGPGPDPPALYIGGSQFERWDGASWTLLPGPGLNSYIYALAAYDPDDGGPQPPLLIAGGTLYSMGGTTVSHIAAWNGTAWSALGAGVSSTVNALLAFDDDGPGPHPSALYAGGSFTTAGGVPAAGLAKWNGSSWSAVGSGLTYSAGNPVVSALAAYDSDGAGPNPPALYVGGLFSGAGGAPANSIARWSGSAWSALGSGLSTGTLPGDVRALAVFDADESAPGGQALYAAGSFDTAGGSAAAGLASWNGSVWSGLNLGPQPTGGGSALAVFDDDGPGPARPALYVGGAFTTAAGLPSARIARYGCPPAAVCYANCDHSTIPPILNVSDFVCFQSQFAAGDPSANCDGSTTPPVLNIADFVCFQQNFAAGCP
jgi:hypothetical protein